MWSSGAQFLPAPWAGNRWLVVRAIDRPAMAPLDPLQLADSKDGKRAFDKTTRTAYTIHG